VVISLLVLMIRHSEPLADLDAGAARWAHHHSGAATHSFLDAVTSLASTRGVIVIAVIVGVVEWIRVPNRWIPVFLLAVTLGDSFVTNTIKGIVDRIAQLESGKPWGHGTEYAKAFEQEYHAGSKTGGGADFIRTNAHTLGDETLHGLAMADWALTNSVDLDTSSADLYRVDGTDKLGTGMVNTENAMADNAKKQQDGQDSQA